MKNVALAFFFVKLAFLSCGTDAVAVRDPGPEVNNHGTAGDAKEIYWQGGTGFADVQWSASGLLVRVRDGGGQSEMNVFARLHELGLERARSEVLCRSSSEEGCPYDRTFRLLSVFGPYVTFADSVMIGGGSLRPFEEDRSSTIDLRELGELRGPHAREDATRKPFVPLDSLFDPMEIAERLAEVDEVRDALESFEIDYKRQPIRKIASALRAESYPPFKGDQYVLSDSFLEDYAIIRPASEGKYLVRLYFPALGVYQLPRNTFVDLELAPKPEIAPLLTALGSDAVDGFLTENSAKLFEGKSSRFSSYH